MNILDKIIARKTVEVSERKSKKSIKELEASPLFALKNISMVQYLKDPAKTGIIAEHKRKSPSKGVINGNVKLEDVVTAYEKAGASCISVLTDIDFFGGSDQDLLTARGLVSCPLLRKDFIIDEYQIVEAKALGANIILLIAACLSPERLKQLATFTNSLGMEVLLEVHNEEELMSNLWDNIQAIGVNNRNLKTFEVSIQTSMDLASKIPDAYIKISESGIDNPDAVKQLKTYGYQGFLIGENFMKTADPGAAIREFAQKIK